MARTSKAVKAEDVAVLQGLEPIRTAATVTFRAYSVVIDQMRGRYPNCEALSRLEQLIAGAAVDLDAAAADIAEAIQEIEQ